MSSAFPWFPVLLLVGVLGLLLLTRECGNCKGECSPGKAKVWNRDSGCICVELPQ